MGGGELNTKPKEIKGDRYIVSMDKSKSQYEKRNSY